MSPALTSYPSFSLPFPPASNCNRYQPYSPLSSLSKLTLNPISSGPTNWSAPWRDGLPTPPADMNGVAYNSSAQLAAPSNAAYATKQYHQPAAFHYANANANAKPAQNRVPLANTVSNAAPNYLPPLTKQSTTSANVVSDPKSHKRSEKESIPAYSQIPASISKSGGNLAEFAAQIACLFWFEKTSKLKTIEDSVPHKYSLVPEAFPTLGFQKWVSTVLSTTQVSQNVILLALLFIYRLKKFNPGVRGKKGSEFRLMTIALMMGNKFLDDNTYTNKTWAEVSGITVQEIHIMEVEFLSNVRYNLFVSKEEWTRWHSKLARFADFFEKASRMPPENELAPTTPILQISPTDPSSLRNALPVSPASKLPSPPATNQLQPQPTQPQPTWKNPTPTSNPSTTTPYRLNTPPRPPLTFEFPPYPRKRSWEDDVDEHPSKRMAIPNNYSAPIPAMPVSAPVTVPSVPVLPPVMSAGNMPLSVPSLAIPVPRLHHSANYHATPNSLVAPQLPATTVSQQLPLPHVRAMPTVYNPTTTWSQQIPPTATVAPVVPAISTSNPMTLYNPSVSLPDPSRRQSPYSAATSSDAVSPSSAFPVHTPQNHLSPSVFLVNRNSPYRPVRAVNTLLIPPPSASLHQHRHLSMDQMHYQPLGKTMNERRTGVLPYLHQGPIPQPNFLPSQTY